MKTEWKGAFIVFVMVAACGSLAFADVAATVDPGAIATIDAIGNQSAGWRFFVDQEMTITDLGLYDDGDNGLASSHTAAIWRVSKTGGLTLMRQVDIGPGGTTEARHVGPSSGQRAVSDMTISTNPQSSQQAYPATITQESFLKQSG